MKKVFPLIAVFTLISSVAGAQLEHYGTIMTGLWWSQYERWYDDTTKTEGTGLQTVTTPEDPRVPDNLEFLPYGMLGSKYSTEKLSAVFEMVIANKIMGAKMSGVTANKVITSFGMDIIASKWYAEWYINPMFTFLIGQNTALTNLSPSNQALYGGNGLGNIGCLTTGKRPMIQLAVQGNQEAALNWEAKAAAVGPDTISMMVGLRDQDKMNVVSHKMPKIEGKFGIDYKGSPLEINAAVTGGYLAYGMTSYDPQHLTKDMKINIQSYVWGGETGIKFGPATLSATVAGGKNVGVYGVTIGSQFVTRFQSTNSLVDIFYPKHFPDTNGVYKVLDGTMIEGALVLNVKPLEWLALEGGYGTIMADHDYDESYLTDQFKEYAERASRSYVYQWNDTHAWYGQVDVMLAQTLQLTCEYGQHIWGPHYGYGRMTYFGFNTSVSF